MDNLGLLHSPLGRLEAADTGVQTWHAVEETTMLFVFGEIP